MPDLPKHFKPWPDAPVADIQAAYEAGFAGAWDDQAAKEELRDLTFRTSGYRSVADAAHGEGWAGQASGKLITPFLHAEKLWPGCFPGDKQLVGSCVSHSTAKAVLITMACDIVSGIPDSKTGIIEGPPEISAAGIQTGVVHPSPIYWLRGYSSHGWSCPAAAKVVVNQIGAVLCQNYEELGVNLTDVTQATETMYGSRSPPAEMLQAFGTNRIHSAAECNSFEQIEDALFIGCGVSSCGSEAWVGPLDENGVAKQRGGWAHALAIIASDSRKITLDKYGEPLICIQNSWGPNWITGPRRILGTKIDIPPGAFWSKWSDAKRRYFVAFAGINGWKSKQLPDYGICWP